MPSFSTHHWPHTSQIVSLPASSPGPPFDVSLTFLFPPPALWSASRQTLSARLQYPTTHSRNHSNFHLSDLAGFTASDRVSNLVLPWGISKLKKIKGKPFHYENRRLLHYCPLSIQLHRRRPWDKIWDCTRGSQHALPPVRILAQPPAPVKESNQRNKFVPDLGTRDRREPTTYYVRLGPSIFPACHIIFGAQFCHSNLMTL